MRQMVLVLASTVALVACGSAEPEPTVEPADTPSTGTAEGAEGAAAAPADDEVAEPTEPPAPTREEAAAEVVRARAAMEAADDDDAADVAARLALAAAYARWAAANASEGECLPEEEAPEPGRERAATPFSHDRLSARRQARALLDCAADRGADEARIAEARARLARDQQAAAAWCTEHQRRPAAGRASLVGTLGHYDPCPSGLNEAIGGPDIVAIERVLGVERAGGGGDVIQGNAADLFDE